MRVNANARCEHWDDLVVKMSFHKDDTSTAFLQYESACDVLARRPLQTVLSSFARYIYMVWLEDGIVRYVFSNNIVLNTSFRNLLKKFMNGNIEIQSPSNWHSYLLQLGKEQPFKSLVFCSLIPETLKSSQRIKYEQ